MSLVIEYKGENDMEYLLALLFNIFLLIFGVWIILLIITLVHEMGHAFMYKIFFRDKYWHIEVGRGRTIIKLRKFTIRIIPASGFCHFDPQSKGSKIQYIMTYLGGPLASLLIVVLTTLLLQLTKARDLTIQQENWVWFLEFAFWASFCSFVLTILPIKYPHGYLKGLNSDALRAINCVLEKPSKD